MTLSTHRIRRVFNFILFIVLPLIPLAIFWFIPMVISLWLSFTDWDYISPTFKYVMLDNYTDLLMSDTFYQALFNTLQFAVATIVPTIVIGFFLALLLNKEFKGDALFKSFIFMPWVTPMVAVSIVWSWIFDPSLGLANKLLDFVGIQGPKWLTDSNTAMWAVIIVTIWKNAGWAMLFYVDALKAIPDTLFEVTELSGASWWQKVRRVYLPLVSPTTLFLAIMMTIDAIQAYDQINVMTKGGPAGSTRTLLYYYYQLAFENFKMGQATALAILILILCGILAMASMQLSKRYVHY